MNRRMRRIGSLLICFALILGISLTAVSKDFSIFDVAAETAPDATAEVEVVVNSDPDYYHDKIVCKNYDSSATVWELDITRNYDFSLKDGLLTIYYDLKPNDISYTDFDKLTEIAKTKKGDEKAALLRYIEDCEANEVPVTAVVIGDGVTTIKSKDGFRGWNNLSTVSVAKTLENIGSGVFDAPLLKVAGYTDNCNIRMYWDKNIPDVAFKDCTSLEKVFIPDAVKTIGREAFAGCSSLNEVVLPEKLETVYASAFENCEKLTSIEFPASTKSIDKDSFKNTGLTDVYFKCPGSVRIDKTAFTDTKAEVDDGVVNGKVYYGVTGWDIEKLNKQTVFNGGYHWTWSTYDPSDLISISVTNSKRYYFTGDNLDLKAITVTAKYGSGRTETIPVIDSKGNLNPAVELSVMTPKIIEDPEHKVPLLKAEKKEISVTYKNKSEVITIYVHDEDWSDVTAKCTLPESKHPYAANITDSQTLTVPNARALKVTFSDNTEVEYKPDEIELKDANNNPVESVDGKENHQMCFTGTELAGKTVYVPGNVLKIKLTSDVDDEYYGYSIAKVEAATFKHIPGDTDNKEATCTEDGYKGEVKCTICDETISAGETLPALGHSYKDGVCERCGADSLFGDSDIVRLYGDNRFDTAFAIADQMKYRLGVEKFDAIIVAYSQNFPDSISASYLAVEKNAPIIVVDSKNNPGTVEACKAYVENNLAKGGTLYILGGSDVMSNDFVSTMSLWAKKNDVTLTQFAGNNRFDTNQMILDEAGTPKDEVIICTGEDFADALTVSASGKPILLVNTGYDVVEADVEAYIKANLAKNAKIYIIGGTEAVSQEFQDKLANAGYTAITRVGGASRFDTSMMVSKFFFGDVAELKTIACAWSEDFTDALCAGPLANKLGAPLLLINEGSQADVTKAGFPAKEARVIAFGGPGSDKSQLTDKTVNYLRAGEICELKYQATIKTEETKVEDTEKKAEETAKTEDTSKTEEPTVPSEEDATNVVDPE